MKKLLLKKIGLILLVLVCLGLTAAMFVEILTTPSANIGRTPIIKAASYEGWQLIKEDGSCETLSENQKLNVSKNEIYRIKNTIPTIDYSDASIVFYSLEQNVKVYIDGNMVYTYGDFAEDLIIETVPSHWNFISLSQDDTNKEIIIELYATSDEYDSYLPQINIGTSSQCKTSMILYSLFDILVSFVFIVFAIFLITILVIHRSFKIRNANFIMFAVIFIFQFAFWFLFESSVEQFFFDNPYVAWLIKSMLVLTFPISLVLMVKSLTLKNDRMVRASNIALAYSYLSILLSLFVQFFRIEDIDSMKWITYPSIIFCVGHMILIIYNNVIKSEAKKKKFLIAICSACVLFVLGLFITDYVLQNKSMYDALMSVGVLLFCIGLSIYSITLTKKRLEERVMIAQELENRQLVMSLNQIKPHFLYNTLSAIRSLITVDPEKAGDLIYKFSKYLRTNIDGASKSGLVPFINELEHIKTYADIVDIRFGGRLGIEYYLETVDFDVPLLSIQPLVENAFLHGLAKKRDGGMVRLRVYEHDDNYIITVSDDGLGFRPEDVNPDALGITNVRYRIEGLVNGTLEIKSVVDKGTIAKVVIPKKEESD